MSQSESPGRTRTVVSSSDVSAMSGCGLAGGWVPALGAVGSGAPPGNADGMEGPAGVACNVVDGVAGNFVGPVLGWTGGVTVVPGGVAWTLLGCDGASVGHAGAFG